MRKISATVEELARRSSMSHHHEGPSSASPARRAHGAAAGGKAGEADAERSPSPLAPPTTSKLEEVRGGGVCVCVLHGRAADG